MSDDTETEDGPYIQWAETELRRAGLFDEDSDYGGMMGESVMKMVRTFDGEGHSGYSAMMAAQIFSRLSAWKPLTPLTDDPDEWMLIEGQGSAFPEMASTWQNRRQSSCFSQDGGHTYYDIDEPQGWWHGTVLRRLYRWTGKKSRGWMLQHTSERSAGPATSDHGRPVGDEPSL